MPITNSGSPTTPPVTPMTQPNQIQGNLYPFSAFSADNPNLVSAPMLTLKSPWRFSAPGVVSPLSAAPSANVIYTLPLTYPATHKIYIPAAYLVASSGGPYTLTIKTATGTSVVYVPIIKSGDTLLSGNLMFDVYVDASGNVTSSAWEIAAYNAYGYYEQRYNGRLHQYNTNIAAIVNTGYIVLPCVHTGSYVIGVPNTINTSVTWNLVYLSTGGGIESSTQFGVRISDISGNENTAPIGTVHWTTDGRWRS